MERGNNRWIGESLLNEISRISSIDGRANNRVGVLT
jgi:hypothetical protein